MRGENNAAVKAEVSAETAGRWLWSLRVKLLAALVPLTVISVAVGMVGLGTYLHTFFRRNAEHQANRLGVAIQSTLHPAMLENSVDSLGNALANLANDPEVRRVWIIDKNGRVGHAADKPAVGRVLDKSHDPICTVCHLHGNIPDSQTYFTRDETGAHVLRHVSPIANDKACWGCHDSRRRLNGILLLEQSTQSFEDALGAMQYRLGATGGITLVILVGLTLVVTTLIVERPVRSLAAGVRRIGAGDLAVRIPVRGRDELADLGGAFNRMAEDLGNSVDELRNKNSELSMVYSIVEQLTKTIHLGELKEIILNTMMDVFAADQVMLLSHLTRSESGETLVKTREKKRLGRVHQDEDAGAAASDGIPPDIAGPWLRGELQRPVVTPDGRVAALPVHGEDRKLALLVIRRDHPFEPREVNPNLLGALTDHIRVALENARLFTLAITDELTQLFTVRHFHVRVEDALLEYEQRGQAVSLLMLDLDHFKSVNDRFGHPAGDEALRQIARILRKSVRAVDSAYRYGGDEFAVLLPDTNSVTARIVAERVRRDVEALKIAVGGGADAGVTVSIGIASCPANGASYDGLVASADAALYQAKRTRNCLSEPPTPS